MLDLVMACSYSPALYRGRSRWPAIYAKMAGDAVQPASAAQEDDARLDNYAARQAAAFDAMGAALTAARPEALVVVSADHGTVFDRSNAPQLHIYIGESIWGDMTEGRFNDEPTGKLEVPCNPGVAAYLAEELAFAGFDISESRTGFRPANADKGAGPRLIQPALRLAAANGIPIVPVFLNCSVEPIIKGWRIAEFGREMGRILSQGDASAALLASGGLSGDPGGYMSGWVDETLDTWLMKRLAMGRSGDLTGIWEVDSLTTRGSTRDVRIWLAAGAAAESAGLRGRTIDYMPFHHGAAGIGFMQWGRG